MTSSEPESDSTNSSRHSFYNLCSTNNEPLEESVELSAPYGTPPGLTGGQGCEYCQTLLSSCRTTCPHKYLPSPPSGGRLLARRRSSFPPLVGDALHDYRKPPHLHKRTGSSGAGARGRKSESSVKGLSENALQKKVSLSGVMLANVLLPFSLEDENDADDDDDGEEEEEPKDKVKVDLSDSGHSSTFSFSRQSSLDHPFSRQSSLDHQYLPSDQDVTSPTGPDRKGLGEEGFIKYRGRRFRVITEERYEDLTARRGQQASGSTEPPTSSTNRRATEAPTGPTQTPLTLTKDTLVNPERGALPPSLSKPVLPPSIDVISPSPTLTTSSLKTSQSVGRQLLQSSLSLRAITPDYLTSRSSGTSSSGSLSPASVRCTSSHSNSSIDSTSPLPPLVRTPTLRRGNLLPPICTGSRTPSTASSSRTSSPFDPLPPHVFSPIINVAPEFPGSGSGREYSEYDQQKSPVEITTTLFNDLSGGAVGATYQPLPSPLTAGCHTSPTSDKHRQRKESGRTSTSMSKGRRRFRTSSKSQTSMSSVDDGQSYRSDQSAPPALSGRWSGTDETVRSQSRSTNSSIDVLPPDPDDYFRPHPLTDRPSSGEVPFHLPDIKKRQSSSTYKSPRTSTYKLESPDSSHPRRGSSQLADFSLKGSSIKLLNNSRRGSPQD